MAKYIFIQDHQSTTIGNAPIAIFKKGDVYSLQESNIQPSWLPYKMYVYKTTFNNKSFLYTVPGNVIKPYKSRFQEDVSYLGQEQLEKQNDNVKTLLIVVSLVAVAIVVYLLAKGKLFKSLQA